MTKLKSFVALAKPAAGKDGPVHGESPCLSLSLSLAKNLVRNFPDTGVSKFTVRQPTAQGSVTSRKTGCSCTSIPAAVQDSSGAAPPRAHPAHGRDSGCATMCRHAIARGPRAPRSTPPTSRQGPSPVASPRRRGLRAPGAPPAEVLAHARAGGLLGVISARRGWSAPRRPGAHPRCRRGQCIVPLGPLRRGLGVGGAAT